MLEGKNWPDIHLQVFSCFLTSRVYIYQYQHNWIRSVSSLVIIPAAGVGNLKGKSLCVIIIFIFFLFLSSTVIVVSRSKVAIDAARR